MTTSVVVPTRGLGYLLLFFGGLRAQTLKLHEVVVAKDCDFKQVEELLEANPLRGFVLGQVKGYFTHALNMGKKVASSGIVVPVDDVILPPDMPRGMMRCSRGHRWL